ncbi:hypothetical protein VN12_24470 [Pirellula sp. SH-Sr6A]|uniref:hypothetical protein n=1 Tax=Pirellula sp. SH-Sr6A TaxID=1632865 RepID=UPI00078E6061|nr:hypothetical protein [Pirellula sp. SH-Sr6A]AMV35303.1 hypothetical protein VN12_24470 [Pirellula sp. SH-Sr6A]
MKRVGTFQRRRSRLTSAHFLFQQRQLLESIAELHSIIDELPLLAATDPALMKTLFVELTESHAAVVRITQKFATNQCTEEKIRDFT